MKIALIGRPNVGKSTLFNRLVGSKSAIVGDMPGITRDRKCINAELCGLNFSVLDTPGVDTFSKASLASSMNEQSFSAINEADVVFFVVDAKEGVAEYDKAVAAWIRSSFKKCGNKPVVLIKNKSESGKNYTNFETLGFGEGIPVSAEHGLGLDDIYCALSQYDFPEEVKSEEIPAMKVAIVGRPNVGKSTLINAIIGEDRLLTGSEAGITRDAISINWKFNQHKIQLIDTAGQRRQSKVDAKVEAISVMDAKRHIKCANVVVVVMDINNPLEKQDVTIARKVLEEGKIIIFALNKSDSVSNPDAILKNVEQRLEKEFAQIPKVSCLLVSAKEKKGLARIFKTALKLYDLWTGRVSTSLLNKWFQRAIAQNPPPLVNGLPIKLKYVSQTNSKPPTFAVFANRVEHLPSSYERYLINNLRKSFDLWGVPVRLFVRQRQNPFA